MSKTPDEAATREALGPGLLKAADRSEIVVVDADLGKSTTARLIADQYPDRFITFGIAEQNMASAAAGIATTGFTVVASTFAVFAEHAFDQWRMSVAQPNLDVKLFASHGGVSTGEDGASAQSVEDIGVFSSLVNFTVCVPADVVEADAMVAAAIDTYGPWYVRLGRAKVPTIYENGSSFKVGQADTLRNGDDVSIIACGLMVDRALQAAELLSEDGIQARVINMSTIRPLDTATLFKAAGETGAIVVAEEHLVHSGLGALCAQALASENPVPMEFVGIQNRYGESGKWFEILELLGLTVEGITDATRRAVSRK